jgi:saccharopine dehydrogenase (NAD+, L-lysine-forming)
MTKIIVLGGAGGIASQIVRELAVEPKVTSITIAEVDMEAAEQLASELGDKVSAVRVKFHDPSTMVEVIRGHDAAVNNSGPFCHYEVPITQAAIEAGVPCLSLCDDPDAAQAVQALDKAAKSAGVSVLIGMGWAPGLAGLLVRKGLDELGQVDIVQVAWAKHVSTAQRYDAIKDLARLFSKEVMGLQYGRKVYIKGGSDKESVLFPPPVGLVNCYHVGYPAPLGLVHGRESVDTVQVKGGLAEQMLNDVAWGLTRLQLGDLSDDENRVNQTIQAALERANESTLDLPPYSALRVDLRNREGGQEISYGVATRRDEAHSSPETLAALMLAQGDIDVPGVITPEQGFETDVMLEALEERGVTIHDLTGQTPPPPPEPEGPPLAVKLGFAAAGVLASLIGMLVMIVWLFSRKKRHHPSQTDQE